MKKVLFLIHDLGDGGAEKVLVNLVNNLSPTKFDITLMTLFDVGVNRQFLNKNIHYRYCFKHMPAGNSHFMKLLSPGMLHKLLIREKYDIEISYLEGPSARVISGCPKVDTTLISWIHVEQHDTKTACKSFRSYSEASKCYERFHKTVCVSEYVKKDFSSIFPDVKNILVRYNTNETNQILRMMKDEVTEGLFKVDEIKIVGVGKIMPNKGFDKLARIHCKLRTAGYNVHTYLLGKGEDEEKIRQIIKNCDDPDTFTFLGYQTNPYKYMSKCDLFVCASNAEGFSTAATEALIVGIPIVTTRVSGMEEMLGTNNEYGIITEKDEDSLYDGIEKILSDEKMLLHYRAKAKERGKSFRKEETIQAIEELLGD